MQLTKIDRFHKCLMRVCHLIGHSWDWIQLIDYLFDQLAVSKLKSKVTLLWVALELFPEQVVGPKTRRVCPRVQQLRLVQMVP